MLIKNVYVFQSVLECIGKVIVFVATVVSLTSCSRAQASRAAKQQEVKNKENVATTNPLAQFYACGLPKDAYPVAFYGEDSIPYNNLNDARKREYLDQSFLVSAIQDFDFFTSSFNLLLVQRTSSARSIIFGCIMNRQRNSTRYFASCKDIY